jgi:primosomal protein N'
MMEDNKEYPPMAIQCPDCDAIFLLHGDFGQQQGQFVRMATTSWESCDRCMKIREHCFEDE